MDPQRWRQVTEVFDGAMAQAPDQRDTFLDEACGADAALRAEVRALLDAEARAGPFLESPTALSGALLEPPPVLRPGEHVGVYRVLHEIARGGMGVVYRAEDERLARPVAIKSLSPALLHDAHARERLRREAQAAARLSHPAVATVYALEERGDDLFIVSEFVEGRTLRARLADGPVGISDAIRLGLGVARGLAAAHAHRVVHRDLKPENVMEMPDGGVKVLDFGIAHIETTAPGPALTRAGLLGTPGYMAPEQLRSGPVDARADVFALGILLYELVTGIPPFGRGTSPSVIVAVLEQEPPAASLQVPTVPLGLDQVIRTCLQKLPAARYGSAGQVAAALEALHVRPGATLPPADVGHVPPASPSRALWWWQFHEVAAAAAHTLMLIPAWQMIDRLPDLPGRLIVIALVATAAATGIVRLHLRFVSRHDPSRLADRLADLGPRLRWGDRLFAGLLAGSGLAATADAGYATLLVALAAGSLVASHVVEPASAESALASLGQDR